MGRDPELARLVHQTRKEALDLRQSSQEARCRTVELMSRARDLCAQYREVHAQETTALVQKEPEAYRRIHSLQAEILEQLRQSLSDLENTRMMSDDPDVRSLKEDICKALKSSGNRSFYNEQ